MLFRFPFFLSTSIKLFKLFIELGQNGEGGQLFLPQYNFEVS